jgi:hypothetical protein
MPKYSKSMQGTLVIVDIFHSSNMNFIKNELAPVETDGP